MNNICNVPDCTNDSHSRGLCPTHYNRWNYDRRNGKDPRYGRYVEESNTGGEGPDGTCVSNHPLYSVWLGMKTRCYNENQANYKWYGARGVEVCKRWRESFEAFLSDVPERPTEDHTLDRIDPHGDYEPGNIRWSLPTTQAQNRRGSLSVETVRSIYESEGTQKEIAEANGVSAAHVSHIKTGKCWEGIENRFPKEESEPKQSGT